MDGRTVVTICCEGLLVKTRDVRVCVARAGNGARESLDSRLGTDLSRLRLMPWSQDVPFGVKRAADSKASTTMSSSSSSSIVWRGGERKRSRVWNGGKALVLGERVGLAITLVDSGCVCVRVRCGRFLEREFDGREEPLSIDPATARVPGLSVPYVTAPYASCLVQAGRRRRRLFFTSRAPSVMQRDGRALTTLTTVSLVKKKATMSPYTAALSKIIFPSRQPVRRFVRLPLCPDYSSQKRVHPLEKFLSAAPSNPRHNLVVGQHVSRMYLLTRRQLGLHHRPSTIASRTSSIDDY